MKEPRFHCSSKKQVLQAVSGANREEGQQSKGQKRGIGTEAWKVSSGGHRGVGMGMTTDGTQKTRFS